MDGNPAEVSGGVVVVLGAGPAGLTAAHELLTRKPGTRVVVLEKNDHVGGLSATHRFGEYRIDLGGHRFFSKSDRVLAWWLERLPLSGEVPPWVNLGYQGQRRQLALPHTGEADPRAGFVVRPRKSRILHDGEFYDYPLRLSAQTLATLGLARTLRFGITYGRRRVWPVRPETSLADFYRNRFGDALYETFFKSYTEKVWGVPCEALSAEWGAQRVKGVSVLEALRQALVPRRGKATEASLIEQFLYPYYGPGQLWNRVADEVRALGGDIVHGARVVSLAPEEVRFQDSRGQTHSLPCAGVFSSIPLNELGSLLGSRLSDTARDIATRLAYRHFVIVGLAVPTLRYRGQRVELTDTWIYLQDSRVRAGRLQLFHNWSPGLVPEPGQPWVGLEYFCSDTDALWQAPDPDLTRLAAAELELLGLARATDTGTTAVVRAPKAYPVYAGAWQEFDRLKAELLTLPNLYCIGRNGMHRYNNQDHSMLTAFAAVDHWLRPAASDPAAIWDINTEDDYHETKT